MFSRLFFALILLFCSFKAEVDKSSLEVGEAFILKVKTEGQNLDRLENQIKGFAFKIEDKTESQEGIFYTLRATREGNFILYFDVEEKNRYIFPPLTVKAKSIEAISPNFFSLSFHTLSEKTQRELDNEKKSRHLLHRESKERLDYLRAVKQWKSYIPWILLSAALLLLGFYVMKIAWKRKEESFLKDLLRNLSQLEKDLISDKLSQQEFYTQLSFLLRMFIEKAFGIPALEMTSEEFFEKSLQNPVFNSSQKKLLKDMLYQADLVKFAKKAIDRDQSFHLLKSVKAFMESHDNQEK